MGCPLLRIVVKNNTATMGMTTINMKYMGLLRKMRNSRFTILSIRFIYFIPTDMPGRSPSNTSVGRAFTSKVFRS